MKLGEVIDRLRDLREIVGDDAEFCVERERTESGRVKVFCPASVEIVDAMRVESVGQVEYVSLMHGNHISIVVAECLGRI
jgi:CO dehydrogenase/acetyl-CoA synthase alpha subunit